MQISIGAGSWMIQLNSHCTSKLSLPMEVMVNNFQMWNSGTVSTSIQGQVLTLYRWGAPEKLGTPLHIPSSLLHRRSSCHRQQSADTLQILTCLHKVPSRKVKEIIFREDYNPLCQITESQDVSNCIQMDIEEGTKLKQNPNLQLTDRSKQVRMQNSNQKTASREFNIIAKRKHKRGK